MRTLRPLLVRLLLPLAAVTLIVACGGGEEEPAAPGPAARPAPAPTAARPSTPEKKPLAAPVPSRKDQPREDRSIGEQLRQQTELPDFYPDDAPVYPGTSPASATRKGGKASVMFGTADDPDTVARYMNGYLTEQGWSPVSQRVQDKIMIQGRKSDRMISVLVARTDEGQSSEITMIGVSVDE